MTGARSLGRGALSAAPLALSIVPFGIVAALAARDAGLSVAETIGASVFIFAGAAQLTASELAHGNSPMLLVIAAAMLVNLRFLMYSASLAHEVQHEARGTRALMAYLLTDQAFGLATSIGKDEGARTAYFFFGAGLLTWLGWQLGTVLGVSLGSAVPPELSLDFSVGLAFIALVVPHLRDRATLAAALASSAVFLLAWDLPYGLPLLPAAAAGIAVGLLTESRAQ